MGGKKPPKNNTQLLLDLDHEQNSDTFILYHTVNVACVWSDATASCPPGNGPCLGFRKPGEPYQWISYTEVWHVLVFYPPVVVALLYNLCNPLLFASCWLSPSKFLRWRSRRRCWALGCWPKAASRTRSSLSGYLRRTDQRYELTSVL